MKDWQKLKTKLLKDPETRKEYDNLEGEFNLARELIDLRLKRKLTQLDVAERAGLKQSAIARLESGRANPSYRTLQRVTKALGAHFKIV